MAKPPQPVPISSTWSLGFKSNLSQMTCSFLSEAASKLQSVGSKIAAEYIMVESSHSLKKSLPKS